MTNPWLAGSELVSAQAIPPVLADRSTQRGAQGPQAGVGAPDVTDRLLRRETTSSSTTWWLGAHGGAGESTLAALAAGSRAAGHAWPIPVPPTIVHRVVLVARSNFAGFSAARHAAIDWASGSVGGGVQLVGVALMADSRGRLPKPLRDLEQVLAGGVPRVWQLPWVETWRFGPPSPDDVLPKEFRLFFADLALPLTGSTAAQ
jgi:hypothetical protein